MIRNPVFMYIGIGALFFGVLMRFGDSVGLPEGLLESMPGTKAWVALAIGSLVLSVIPLKDLFASAKTRTLKREDFEPDSVEQISLRIKKICEEKKPDIPLLVDYVVFQARALNASDIHFDPARSGFIVRFRLDGMMSDVAMIPSAMTGSVVNRLKVLSNLVVYEGYMPQDGRLESSDREQQNQAREQGDFRIAFMPTLHGERIVIRILGRSGGEYDFKTLGMSDAQLKSMTAAISKAQGMIILTGPTGSGKTTTIYSALRVINDETQSVRSISTLEDPIECEIQGINQSQVNDKKNFTFHKGLRAILRQDPDVIMVGEIRDAETAATAIQAGMTGHLIITTVHANSTAATFSRLLEMGIAPYSINTAVTAVIAQRLVRRLCTSCRHQRDMTPEEKTKLGVAVEEEVTAFEGLGCAGCDGTGYKGRYALFEILEVTEPIRSLVAKEASADAIYGEARSGGMLGLFESGIVAIKEGVTSPQEVLRVVVNEHQ